jgi:hypothetical protein
LPHPGPFDDVLDTVDPPVPAIALDAETVAVEDAEIAAVPPVPLVALPSSTRT